MTRKFLGTVQCETPVPPDRKVTILQNRRDVLGIFPHNLPQEMRSEPFEVVAQDKTSFSDGAVSLLLLMPNGIGHCGVGYNHRQYNPYWGSFAKDANGAVRFGWWVYESDCEVEECLPTS